MHRSGTSMIAALLQRSGIYLGEEIDFLPAQKNENPEGFLEHFAFYALNERLLLHLGAGWDMPALPAGWESRADLAPFRDDALKLIERMRASSIGKADWGWKDPRNSITIQFWKALLPDLHVVVCVRNPLEVAASLQRRNNFSTAASVRLWMQYYRNILENVPVTNRVVTSYESYFADPAAELKRVLAELGLPLDEGAFAAIPGLVKPGLHHNHATLDELRASECNPEAIGLYMRLQAGTEIVGEMREPRAPAGGRGDVADTDLQRSRFHVETAQREELIQRLGRENVTLKQELEAMAAEIKALAARSEEIEKSLAAVKEKRETHSRKLARMAEHAVAVHGLIAHKRSQYAFLQGRVESTLKETRPLLPRIIRFSNSINSIYRIFKRIRKMGKLFTLQRELNDATSESLGTITHMTTLLIGHSESADGAVPPGLERYAFEKTRMNVSELMAALRIRLL